MFFFFAVLDVGILFHQVFGFLFEFQLDHPSVLFSTFIDNGWIFTQLGTVYFNDLSRDWRVDFTDGLNTFNFTDNAAGLDNITNLFEMQDLIIKTSIESTYLDRQFNVNDFTKLLLGFIRNTDGNILSRVESNPFVILCVLNGSIATSCNIQRLQLSEGG